MGSIPIPDEPSESASEITKALPPGKRDLPSPNETIADRLTRLANLSTLHRNQATPLTLDARTVHQCLDTLESLLDPRSNLTREISLCRRPQTSPGARLDFNNNAPRKLDTSRKRASSDGHSRFRSLEVVSARCPARMSSELVAVHDEVKMLGEAFVKRREETLHIYMLYDMERKRLESRVAELEADIEELRVDMQEDLAEREALQGTVRGLGAWIDGWREDYLLAHQKKLMEASRQDGQGWVTKRKASRPVSRPGGFDTNTLIDGITAWMRGWTDVEEEFRNRDNARRLRRENKQRGQHKGSRDVD
ncbi:hypothetical protein BJX76DRAFT_121833 [Aspergillus varians]